MSAATNEDLQALTERVQKFAGLVNASLAKSAERNAALQARCKAAEDAVIRLEAQVALLAQMAKAPAPAQPRRKADAAFLKAKEELLAEGRGDPNRNGWVDLALIEARMKEREVRAPMSAAEPMTDELPF